MHVCIYVWVWAWVLVGSRDASANSKLISKYTMQIRARQGRQDCELRNVKWEMGTGKC